VTGVPRAPNLRPRTQTIVRSILRVIRWPAGFLLVLGVAALAMRQLMMISRHGVVGWLEGDGGYQPPWEVEAVIALALLAIAALVVIGWRVLERVVAFVASWRLTRAVRHGQRATTRDVPPPT
jgi:hypothetical protein